MGRQSKVERPVNSDSAFRRLSLDPTDPAFYQNPYPAFEAMRAVGPAVFWEQLGRWCLTGYDDVNAVLRDKRFGREILHVATREEVGIAEPPERVRPFYEVDDLSMLSREPPVHTRLRALVNRAFVSRQIEKLHPRVAALANELIDRFGKERADGARALREGIIRYPRPTEHGSTRVRQPISPKSDASDFGGERAVSLGEPQASLEKRGEGAEPYPNESTFPHPSRPGLRPARSDLSPPGRGDGAPDALANARGESANAPALDLIAAFATPIPVTIIAELLGVPVEAAPQPPRLVAPHGGDVHAGPEPRRRGRRGRRDARVRRLPARAMSPSGAGAARRSD